VPGAEFGLTVPVIVTLGGAASAVAKATTPSSQTTDCSFCTEHWPWVAVAAAPPRPTVVVKLTRTAVALPVPVPDNTMVWVTDCPLVAPNGVEVSTGTRSRPSAGACGRTGPASATATPTTLTARDHSTSVL
jgi:hypothetical protein